jgi:DNA-binding NtrC family response regulator
MDIPIQVLLIEDSEDDALLIEHRLRAHDRPIAITRVETAFALQAALDARAWDIVISDYRMPLLSGLDALDIVRRHDRALPFILVSSTVGEDVAVDAMRSGAADYVMKNKLARLLPAFQRELHAADDRRTSASERSAQRRHIERLVHYDATTGLANRSPAPPVPRMPSRASAPTVSRSPSKASARTSAPCARCSAPSRTPSRAHST